MTSENFSGYLYDAAQLDHLEWPATKEGRYAKKFLVPLIQNGLASYFNNIHAKILAFKIEQHIFPIIVAEELANSYVCSPYSHYISLGTEFAKLVGNKVLAGSLILFLNGFGSLCRLGELNKIIYVNNWLFSTDLYPQDLSQEQLNKILKVLQNLYPHHAIAFRSINPILNSELQNNLDGQGCQFIASRYVYLTDPYKQEVLHTRILKSDLKLKRECSYCILNENNLLPSEYEDVLRLYIKLYIEQHSPLQPNFNLKYLKHLIDERLLKFKIIKLNNEIKGAAGFYERGNALMCPFFGYDKQDSDHNAVYRLLNTELLLEAQKRKMIFHQSSGASKYKKIRRAKGCLEYLAVYTRHLPCKQRFTWNSLALFMNKIASKYMERY